MIMIWREQHNGIIFTLTRDEDGNEVGKIRDPNNPREIIGNDLDAVEAVLARYGTSISEQQGQLDQQIVAAIARDAARSVAWEALRAASSEPTPARGTTVAQAMNRIELLETLVADMITAMEDLRGK